MENDRKNQTTRTKKRKKMLTGVLFVTGLLLCIYPAFASLIDRKHQQNVIQTYQGNIEANSEEKLQEMLGEAERYNEMLWQTNGVLIGDIEQGILEEESYQSQLNLSGTSVMGTLSIPKINVDLPIYHGTEEEILANGVGHLQESSLPVGGENTHCILTGHRGLPNAKLFTRLNGTR